MKMWIDGEWRGGNRQIDVRRPLDGEMVDSVPAAAKKDAEDALAAAFACAPTMAKTPAHARAAVLRRAADLCDERIDSMAETISDESGKPLSEARGEASRLGEIFRLAAFEGANLRGETLPLDATAIPPAEDKFGFTLRVPCGVVVAITPFNYPALLVMHKIAPALAAGNAVILKPASVTPLSALRLTEILLEAGLPDNALQCITGGGGDIGDILCADSRVRKISFTGSVAVGEHIAKIAGVKMMSLELGANSPCVIMPDADMEQAAELSAVGGYVNAGQVCISMQRALVHQSVYGDYVEAASAAIKKIKVGAPKDEDTRMSAMISEKEAERVGGWVEEAKAEGARVAVGGERDGALMQPTFVADVAPGMRLFKEEVFGPVLSAAPVADLEEALSLCETGGYGLAASIFTRDVGTAMHFVRAVKSGNAHVNWTPLWRNDLMPYGGAGKSGIGKEGVRSTVESMTETKTAIIHGAPR